VTAVYGHDAPRVFQTARRLSAKTVDPSPLSPSLVLFIDFKRQVPQQGKEEELYEDAFWVIGAGDPYLNGHRLLSAAREALNAIEGDGFIVEKVLIGDLRSTRNFWNPESIRRSIAILVAVLRQARIPTVLFETTMPRSYQRLDFLSSNIAHPSTVMTGAPEPSAVDFADIVVELDPQEPIHSASVTDTRTGRHYTWNLPADQQ
jgi:hypothetical protein